MRESSDIALSMEERAILAIITALVAIIGVCLNGISALLIFRLHVFRNAFGYLMALNSLSNVAILTIFLFWVAPVMVFGLPNGWMYFGEIVGQIAIFFQTTSFHSMLFISINRFAAISFPTFYRTYFTTRKTLYLIFVILAASFAYFCVYFHPSCNFFFDYNSLMWTFAPTACGHALGYYIDFGYSVALFGIIMVLDVVTLAVLRGAHRNLKGRSIQIKAASHASQQRKEVMFFVQAFATSLTYCCMLICFHLISPMLPAGILWVISRTTVWEMAHAGGGVILVSFNREIRRRFVKPWTRDSTSTAPATSRRITQK